MLILFFGFFPIFYENFQYDESPAVTPNTSITLNSSSVRNTAASAIGIDDNSSSSTGSNLPIVDKPEKQQMTSAEVACS